MMKDAVISGHKRTIILRVIEDSIGAMCVKSKSARAGVTNETSRSGELP